MPDARKTPSSGRVRNLNGRERRSVTGWAGAEPAGLLVEDGAPLEGFYEREEWKLACRVAGSKGMSKSDLLPRFLLHVCELSLCGRTEEITEQRIGTQIFNRPPDYNPGEDNIVRSYARTMRKRLEEYFADEGRTETLRICIPRGGYVPVFEPAGQLDVSAPAGALSLAEEKAAGEQRARLPDVPTFEESVPVRWPAPAVPRQSRGKAFALAALMGLVLGALLATAGWWALRLAASAAAQPSAAHAVWSQIFEPSRNTLIVPADSGLGILENLSKRAVTVEQYANGSYLQEMAHAAGIDEGNFNDLGRQRYTSVVDLNIAARISRLPEYIDSRAQIRYARSVTAEDIKDSNAILLGSKHTNPWVALYEPSMNFTLDYTQTVNQSYVVNRSPVANEQATYANGTYESGSPTYGVIAYLPSLDNTGHVLIIEGLNMAATQAAADLLFNERAISPVLKAATRSNGSLQPFELLIRTSSVGATSPRAEILLTRIDTR